MKPTQAPTGDGSQLDRSAGGSELDPDEWVFINPDDRLCVLRGSGAIRPGTVDVVAPDASVFWVWLDEGRGRIAVHEDDDVKVWRICPHSSHGRETQ